MPSDRCRYSPGGTFFFSVMLDPDQDLSLIDNLALLRAVYAKALSENPFQTLAIVILPDHLHAVWRLPDGDSHYALRWRKIKARFSNGIGQLRSDRPPHLRKGELGLWQRRHWEREIGNEDDLSKHLAYCWSDPVRHGLVRKASDWFASSIHREIRSGRLASDWVAPRLSGTFGERGEIRHKEALIEPV